MKDGAVLANAGHFDVEIGLADLARGRRAGVACCRWWTSTRWRTGVA